jgi:hypothetical protein
VPGVRGCWGAGVPGDVGACLDEARRRGWGEVGNLYNAGFVPE